MSNVFEEYAQEREQEMALNCLKKGYSVETIAEILPTLSKEIVQQLNEQLKVVSA